MISWTKEARDFPPDPVSGAKIVRLSGSSIRTENISYDAPRATPDGKRIASVRYIDHLVSPAKALLCHDLTTKFTCLIDREVHGVVIGPSWGGAVYYRRGTTLMRASLETCSTQSVMDMGALPRCWQLWSISPDDHYLLYTGVVQESPETYNLVRVDLHEKTWKLLIEKPVVSPNRLGASYNPVTGDEIQIGTDLWDEKGRYGVGLLADAEGRNAREIFQRSHHACWLGNTGKFAVLIEFDGEKIAHLPQNPDGELYIHSKDGSPPRLIPVPEHIFFHISSSRCGRYVVCDAIEDMMDGVMPIVVVNVESGKYRTLVGDCRCSAGGDAGRQAKPYFTADTRHIIYNADPDGVVNVFAAEIPDGFLESLA